MQIKGEEVIDFNIEMKELIGNDLEKLLLMFQVPKKEHGDKNNKQNKWKNILLTNEYSTFLFHGA